MATNMNMNMNMNSVLQNATTSTGIKIFLGACVMSTCVGILVPPNPWQDFAALPFMSAQTYYSCIFLLLLGGMEIAKQPIVGKSPLYAFMLCCALGCIGSSFVGTHMIQQKEE